MPFAKGQSGNPGGRIRKRTSDGMSLRDFCREHTEVAVRALLEIVQNDRLEPAPRVSAANSILDRGWGKPAQAVEVTGADGGPITTIDLTGAPIEAVRWLAAQVVLEAPKEEQDG